MNAIIAIAEFKNHLEALGYAESTIELYRQGLDRFGGYIEKLGLSDLRQVSHDFLAGYQETVMDEPIAMESKALRIRPVKRMFEHLVGEHKLLVNPAEGIIEISRSGRAMAPVLTISEVQTLLSRPDLARGAGLRDRAILEVLYSSGIRIGELLGLETHHVDLTEKTLTVRRGKGRKERVVPLGTGAAKYLVEYLEKIRPRHGKNHPEERALFLNCSGLPLSGQSVRQAIRAYRIGAGIEKRVSPHTLRRSCATHLLSQGADIRYIQELLGHGSLVTTQVYTRVLPIEVKKTHDRTHPGKDL